MNRIDNSGTGISKARTRRRSSIWLTSRQGEMVVPPVISPETRAKLIEARTASSRPMTPDEYKVGEGMSINPITGMPEFGWLKKTFKSM